MARVVQQRSAPPYLTIVFAFLFLVATTLAVLFYLSADKAKKADAENRALLDKVLSRRERNDGQVQKLLKNLADRKTSDTVVGQLLKQVTELTRTIAGQPMEAQQALDKAKQVLAKANAGQESLADQLDNTLGMLQRAEKKIQDLQSQLAAKNEELKKKTEQIMALLEQQKQKRQRVTEQVTSVEQQLAQREAEHARQLKQAQEEWAKIRAQLEANIAAKTQQLEQLRLRVQALTLELEEFKRRAQPQRQEVAIPLPDGKILNVMDSQNICYINIGKDHNVRPGYTFAVYPSTGIPKDGSDKGSIVVINVKDTVSVCKIVKQSTGDPIIEGDLIGNIAFDPTRTYTFVVEGFFDLHGTGSPNDLGRQEVISLIREYGGKVVDEVNLQTDYLVLGERPRPVKPGLDAQPQQIAVYNEQKKALDRYNAVVEQAKELNIPVLNTNKFLALIGFAAAHGM